MSIHIGDKVVRSLPEEVSDLRKRIDEMEEPKHLYLHCILIGQDDSTEVASCTILSKRAEAYDYEALGEYLNDNGFTDENSLYPASGEVNNGGERIAVGIYLDEYIMVAYIGGHIDVPYVLQDRVIHLF